MRKETNLEEMEKFVSNAKELYWYLPSVKEVRKFDKPLGWPFAAIAADPSWALFYGMSAAQAKERFDWKIVKEDRFFVYLAIEPKTKKDRATFTAARLVLDLDTYLPRQLWFQTPGGREVTWDIVTPIRTGIKLKEEDFAPKVPEGWHLVP
jgi:TIGR03009 family protein